MESINLCRRFWGWPRAIANSKGYRFGEVSRSVWLNSRCCLTRKRLDVPIEGAYLSQLKYRQLFSFSQLLRVRLSVFNFLSILTVNSVWTWWQVSQSPIISNWKLCWSGMLCKKFLSLYYYQNPDKLLNNC